MKNLLYSGLLLIFTFIIFSCSNKFCAQSEKMKNSYDNKIISRAKKNGCIEKKVKVKVLNIYQIALNNKLLPIDLNDSIFLENIEYICKKDKRLAGINSVVYDTTKKVYGYSENSNVYCNYTQNNLYSNLINYLVGKNYESVLWLAGTKVSLFFIITDKKIEVLEIFKSGFKRYDFEEFTKCCWEENVIVF